MKQLKLFSGLFFIAFIISCSGGKKLEFPLTVEKPFVTFASTSSISIAKVEFTESTTVFSIHAKYSPHNWIRIAKSCKLVTDGGTEIPIVSGEGIELDSMFWMPDSGEADFKLNFGAMPTEAKYFDFIECSGDGCFNLYGIQFSSDKPVVSVPAEWKNITYPANETLPASVFSLDTTYVSGYILGYRPDMNISMTIYYTPFGQNQKDVAVRVDEKGNFKVALMPYVPCYGFMYMSSRSIPLILVPGTESTVLIDLTKFSDKSYMPDFKGNLALTQHDLSSPGARFEFNNSLEYDALADKPANEILAYLDSKLNEDYKTIDTMKFCDAVKQYNKIIAETDYLTVRLRYDRFVMNLALRKANVSSDAEYEKFLKEFKHPAPLVAEALLADLPLLDCLNAPYFTLSDDVLPMYTSFGKNFPAITNPDNVEIFKAYSLISKFEKGTPLSGDDTKELDSFKNPAFKKYILKRTAEKDAQLNTLKKNGSAHLHELDAVAIDKILNTILDRYKGKAVFFDIWATWCGPCKAAHKSILPLKEELKGENLVFVYLTGTTSPMDKWAEMIPEITGEHYYLTGEQYQAILKQYESQGVPTYLIFDINGKFSYKSVGYPGNDTMKLELMKAMGK
jgi:thiol-disulfide isomerase/thioredoxin